MLDLGVDLLRAVAARLGDDHVGAGVVQRCVACEVYRVDPNGDIGLNHAAGPGSAVSSGYDLGDHVVVVRGLSEVLVALDYFQREALHLFEGHAGIDARVF